jgi:hypothetical protein
MINHHFCTESILFPYVYYNMNHQTLNNTFSIVLINHPSKYHHKIEIYFVKNYLADNRRRHLLVLREILYSIPVFIPSFYHPYHIQYFFAALLLYCSYGCYCYFWYLSIEKNTGSRRYIAFMNIVFWVTLIGNIHLSVDIQICKMGVNTIYEWVALENV